MIFGLIEGDEQPEDAFVQVHFPHSQQYMVNAIGALLRRWGEEITVPADEMGPKLVDCSVRVMVNPMTNAVKLILVDPNSIFRGATPGVPTGHA